MTQEAILVRSQWGANPASTVPLVTQPRTAMLLTLLSAFELLNRRGQGQLAWATPLGDDPIAFLLDSMSDAVSLWALDGRLLYQNRAAAGNRDWRGAEALLEQFTARGRLFERRCLRYCTDRGDYLLEVIHELPPP